MEGKRSLTIGCPELVEQWKTHSVFLLPDGEYFDNQSRLICLHNFLQLISSTLFILYYFDYTELSDDSVKVDD